MTPKLNPFRQEHCDCLNRVLDSSAGIAELVLALEECGLPVRELKEQNDGNRALAEKLKARFFPHQA